MARGTTTSTKRAPKDTGRVRAKKVCQFCKDKVDWIDYKDVNLLRRFMSDRGKIRARRVSGNCTQHQREIAVAIKTSREVALLPYAQRTTTERSGGRGPRPDRRRDADEDNAPVLPELNVAVPEAEPRPERPGDEVAESGMPEAEPPAYAGAGAAEQPSDEVAESGIPEAEPRPEVEAENTADTGVPEEA